jgi:ABC-type multidrug transport system fused ATPase/permease subunit
VQEAIEKLMIGRTSFIVAHRLSTIRNSSKIIVLDNGIIAESGTHEQLINKANGIYANLSRLQFAPSDILESLEK